MSWRVCELANHRVGFSASCPRK